MDVTVFIIVTVALFGLLLLIIRHEKKETSNYFVYKDSTYKIVRKVKMKLPVQGNWIDSYLYFSINTGQYYVREVKDFHSKFITLKQYQNASR